MSRSSSSGRAYGGTGRARNVGASQSRLGQQRRFPLPETRASLARATHQTDPAQSADRTRRLRAARARRHTLAACAHARAQQLPDAHLPTRIQSRRRRAQGHRGIAPRTACPRLPLVAHTRWRRRRERARTFVQHSAFAAPRRPTPPRTGQRQRTVDTIRAREGMPLGKAARGRVGCTRQGEPNDARHS